MSKARWGVAGLAVTMAVAMGSAALMAQDAAGPRAPRRSSHRMPAHFGQLGLTPEQRQQIYTIRDKFAPKVADLQRQLDEARAQERAECVAVLTEPQKKLLAQYLPASRGRSTASAFADPKPTETKPAPETAKATK